MLTVLATDRTDPILVRRRRARRDLGDVAEPDLRQGTLHPLAPVTPPHAEQIFNASHMVGFDVPHVTHDMILRFMGVNFTALTDGTVRIPSVVGSDSKPVPTLLDATSTPTPVSGTTPEQDKAMWEG